MTSDHRDCNILHV